MEEEIRFPYIRKALDRAFPPILITTEKDAAVALEVDHIAEKQIRDDLDAKKPFIVNETTDSLASLNHDEALPPSGDGLATFQITQERTPSPEEVFDELTKTLTPVKNANRKVVNKEKSKGAISTADAINMWVNNKIDYKTITGAHANARGFKSASVLSGWVKDLGLAQVTSKTTKSELADVLLKFFNENKEAIAEKGGIT